MALIEPALNGTDSSIQAVAPGATAGSSRLSGRTLRSSFALESLRTLGAGSYNRLALRGRGADFHGRAGQGRRRRSDDLALRGRGLSGVVGNLPEGRTRQRDECGHQGRENGNSHSILLHLPLAACV